MDTAIQCQMPMHWISQRYYQAIRCVFTYRRNTVSTKWHILVIMNNYTLTLLLCNCRGPLCSVFLFRLLFSSVFFSPLLFLSLQPENTWEMMTRILKDKMSQAPKALDCEPNPQKGHYCYAYTQNDTKVGKRTIRRWVKEKSTSSCVQGWC